MRSIAQQHHIARMPAFARHGPELQPPRAVADEGMASEGVGKGILEILQRLGVAVGRVGVLRGDVETGIAPGGLVGLDEKGAPVWCVGIRVSNKGAVLGGDRGEDGARQREICSAPEVQALAGGDGRAKPIRHLSPRRATHTVSSDDQVGVEVRDSASLSELQAHPCLGRVPLQHIQQRRAGDGQQFAVREPGHGITDPHRHLMRVRNVDDRIERSRVGFSEVALSPRSKSYTEPECCIGRALFVHGHLGFGVTAFEEPGGVKPAGATAEHGDALQFHRFVLTGSRGPTRRAWSPHRRAAASCRSFPRWFAAGLSAIRAVRAT